MLGIHSHDNALRDVPVEAFDVPIGHFPKLLVVTLLLNEVQWFLVLCAFSVV